MTETKSYATPKKCGVGGWIAFVAALGPNDATRFVLMYESCDHEYAAIREDLSRITAPDRKGEDRNVALTLLGPSVSLLDGMPRTGLRDSAGPAHPRPERRRGRSVAVLAAVLVLGLAFWLLRGTSPDGKGLRGLNVLLITIDTLRADHVGAYGRSLAKTPHLDRLAKEGALFERCISQTPLTLPSHATILSGTYPIHHRVRDNGGLIVPRSVTLVSEVLKENGFATAGFVGAYVLHSKWGLGQGFDTFSDEFDRVRYERILLQNEKRAEEVLEDAKKWLGDNRAKKFFAWIHLFDPHAPYQPPPSHDRYPDHPYRGEVEYVDQAVGRLMSFLKDSDLYDRCLIIVTSDHGESLRGHGEMEHGFFLYEPTLRVPLIVRAPIDFPVKRVGELVELVDIAPTIVDALDLPSPPSFQGDSLLGLLFGDRSDEEPVAYAETFYPRLHFGWSELKAIYAGDWKYILAPVEELYHLDRDAEERENLASRLSFNERRLALKSRIEAFVEKYSGNAAPATAGRLNREDLERLRSLGYVATTVTTDGLTSLPDPKHKIDIYNRLEEASRSLDQGQYDEALRAAGEAVRAEPDLVEGHVLMGNAYQRKGMFREALPSFYRVLELKPDANFTMIDVVSARLNLGDFEKARSEAEAFVQAFPDDPILNEELGVARFYLRDYDQALEAFEKSIEIEPGPAALTKAGEIHAIRGDYERAEAYLDRALRSSPRAKEAHYVLAQMEESRGNPLRALEHYRKELEIDPSHFKASYNLAVLYKNQGDLDSAIEYYRKTLEANPDFNLPYFMIASLYLESGRDLEEAIALCKKGIDVLPRDRSTLVGYQVLAKIYARRGDRGQVELYARKASELLEALGEPK